MIWLRTFLFAMTFVATTLVLIPRWILSSDQRAYASSWVARDAGVLLIGLGTTLMLWCWREFATRGRGTPAPFDAPRRLVIAGPYRYVRNPMYVAALFVLVGQATLFAAGPLLMYAAGFWLVTHAFVVRYEERALAGRFGADYTGYRKAVRRWLPRIKPANIVLHPPSAAGPQQ